MYLYCAIVYCTFAAESSVSLMSLFFFQCSMKKAVGNPKEEINPPHYVFKSPENASIIYIQQYLGVFSAFHPPLFKISLNRFNFSDTMKTPWIKKHWGPMPETTPAVVCRSRHARQKRIEGVDSIDTEVCETTLIWLRRNNGSNCSFFGAQRPLPDWLAAAAHHVMKE